MSEREQRLPTWYYEDNGFMSPDSMDRAHSPLLELTEAIPVDELNRVIDFGCGNGALLKKMISSRPACVPYGLDVSALRIEHARLLHPRFRENFEVCSMFHPSGRWLQSEFELALLMVGRLLEVTSRERDEFIDRLQRRCKRVLLYFYGGWIEADAGLQDLSRRCNLRLLETHPSNTAAFAKLPARVRKSKGSRPGL